MLATTPCGHSPAAAGGSAGAGSSSARAISRMGCRRRNCSTAWAASGRMSPSSSCSGGEGSRGVVNGTSPRSAVPAAFSGSACSQSCGRRLGGPGQAGSTPTTFPPNPPRWRLYRAAPATCTGRRPAGAAAAAGGGGRARRGPAPPAPAPPPARPAPRPPPARRPAAARGGGQGAACARNRREGRQQGRQQPVVQARGMQQHPDSNPTVPAHLRGRRRLLGLLLVEVLQAAAQARERRARGLQLGAGHPLCVKVAEPLPLDAVLPPLPRAPHRQQLIQLAAQALAAGAGRADPAAPRRRPLPLLGLEARGVVRVGAAGAAAQGGLQALGGAAGVAELVLRRTRAGEM